MTTGRITGILLLVSALLFWSVPGQASLYEYLSPEHNYRLDARIRQNLTVGYARKGKGGRQQLIGSEYLVELSSNYSYQNWIRAKLVLNLHGDSMYAWRKNSKTFGSRGVNRKTGNNRAFVPYGADAESEIIRDGCRNSADCSNFLRDYLIREASLVFSDREAGYNITIGKFQRGWGQADGLRLMDVLNPLDFRKRFLLRDFDELRIEQWMADFIFFTEPFFSLHQFGIYNPNIEFVWIPNVRHSEFRINNAFTGENGGIWGFDFPSKGFSAAGPVPDRVFLTTRRVTAGGGDWWSWKEPSLAGRLAWNMFRTDFTFSGLYGWQDLPITRLRNAELHLGRTGGRGPNGRGPRSTPLLTASPAISKLASDLVKANLFDLGTCTPSVPGVSLPQDLINALDGVNPIDGCSVVGNVDLDFRERKKLIGFTAIREMSEIRLPPRQVSPVFRLETSYEFHKPFNTPLVVGPDRTGVRKLDFWSTLFGFDLFLWLPDFVYNQKWLFSQPRTVFTSGQVFWFKAMGNGAGDRRVLWQSPYVDWKRPSNEFWFTFLFFTDVFEDKVHLEGLNVYELENSSYILRQRIEFRHFGDHFIPRIEIGHFEGRGDQVGSVYDNNDYFDLQFLYQF